MVLPQRKTTLLRTVTPALLSHDDFKKYSHVCLIPLQVAYQPPEKKNKDEIRPDIEGFYELKKNREEGRNYFLTSISGGTSIY